MNATNGIETIGIENIQTNLVGTQRDDLIINQGGTKYWGGAGTDTFYSDWSSATANINWINTPSTIKVVNGVEIAQMERLLIETGSGNDNIYNTATGTNDYISTGAGNDTIDAGSGADTMVGGTGNDIYAVDNAGDVITELAGEGIDSVYTTINYTLGNNLENLLISWAAPAGITGTGNALDNLIIGGTAGDQLLGMAGNDTIDGNLGDDTMAGGLGDDLYYQDSVLDIITELAGQGTDTVVSSVNCTLTDNVENLILDTGATNGIGNTSANQLTGNGANNQLVGAGGNDTIHGGIGNDLIYGDSVGSGTVAGSLIQLNQYSFNSSTGVITFDSTGQINPSY